MNPDDFLTISEAIQEIGCSSRCFYRIIDRIGRETVTVKVFGKIVVPKAQLDLIRQHYYPHHSEARKKMAKEWGRRGGTQKGINYRQRDEQERGEG